VRAGNRWADLAELEEKDKVIDLCVQTISDAVHHIETTPYPHTIRCKPNVSRFQRQFLNCEFKCAHYAE
jgi:hypothetical protein